MSLTVVALHAHPDDEVLLGGGTLARAAAAGHRVVLVAATRGEEGLAGIDDGHGELLAERRMAELRGAAEALGCADVRWLGYRDSGLDGSAEHPDTFVRADVETASLRLAAMLREEGAEVLITYDRSGGYGHPDHVQAHRVGMRAAALAATPRILQVTLPGDLLALAQGVLRAVRHPVGGRPGGTTGSFVRRREITHVTRVGPAFGAKRAAMAAHASQRRSEGGVRVLDWLLRLPVPLAYLVLGREWFVDVSPGATAVRGRRDLFPLGRTP